MRHAAALALTVWYLMMPPLGSTSAVQSNAPLSQWTHAPHTEFATEEDCKAVLAEDQASEEAEARRIGPHRDYGTTVQRFFVEATKFYQCVASDDPRLKK